MKALEQLQASLQANLDSVLTRPWRSEQNINEHIAKLEERLSRGVDAYVPRALQEEAVRYFWTSKRLDSLKEARLVSYGVAMPIGSERLRIIEDKERFPVLLRGVDQYLSAPKQYRRCYQGLLSGYFAYDPEDRNARKTGQENWEQLRQYLCTRACNVVDGARNPLWAESLQQHTTIFGENPGAHYGPNLLAGDRTEVDELREVLSISDTSWFMHKLYLGQVQAAVQKRDPEFLELLYQVLNLLHDNERIQDDGLALVLNRFAQLNSRPLAPPLRDAAVNWWGNPWLPSNSMRWGRVSADAREMVTEWLKLAFIEAFFTLLAEEKSGDTRRLNFWKRYVHAIDEIHFALGSDASSANSPDFVALRKKMTGLVTPLHDTTRSNNAFIMRMGPLVIVEFSGYSNACYGYDASASLPFRYGEPMAMRVDANNSLKRSSRKLWLKHQDGNHGFSHWEDRFEQTLASGYGVHPNSAVEREVLIPRRGDSRVDEQQEQRLATPYGREQVGTREAQSPSSVPNSNTLSRARALSDTSAEDAASLSAQLDVYPDESAGPRAWLKVKYSFTGLQEFARRFELSTKDLTYKNGNLWVYLHESNKDIGPVLRAWGFTYRNSKRGWWKSEG